MKKEPKTRILISMPSDLKEELIQEAKLDNRSFNNYVVNMLLNRKERRNE